MHINLLPVLLFATSILSILLIFIILTKAPGNPQVQIFALLMVCITVYVFGYASELSSAQLSSKIFWTDIQYTGISFIPTLWFIFVAQYMGEGRLLKKRFLILFILIPLATILLKFTDGTHQLIYRNIGEMHINGYSFLTFTRGPWYILFNTYMLLALLTGLAITIRALARDASLYKGKAKIVLAGSSAPIIAYILYFFNLPLSTHVDFIAPSFAITGILAFWGIIYNFKIFDLMPIARHIVIDKMGEGILVTDVNNRILDANKSMSEILQYDAPEIIGKDAAEIFEGIFLPNEIHTETETIWQNRERTFNIRTVPVNNKRKVLGRLFVFHDITERRLSEKFLMEKGELQNFMVTMATDFINIPAEDATLKINQAMEAIGRFANADRSYVFKHNYEAATTSSTLEWCAKDIPPRIGRMQNIPLTSINRMLEKHYRREPFEFTSLESFSEPEQEFFRKRGVKTLVTIPISQDKRCIGFIGLDHVKTPKKFSDSETDLLRITAEILRNIELRIQKEMLLRETEEKLRFDALHDSLTQLANRTLLQDRINQAILQNLRNTVNRFLLMFLDIDDFKAINDRFGHKEGDTLLQTVARRLEEHLRPEDTLARLGGDEFAILMQKLPESDTGEKIAERILQAIRRPIDISGNRISISASIGICLYSEDIKSVDEYLRNSDMAMYKAKREGKNRIAHFSNELLDHNIENIIKETRLFETLNESQMHIDYQPIVSLVDGKVAGYSAIPSWVHPQQGSLSPEDLYPFAEKTGLVVDIACRLVENALKGKNLWKNSPPSGLSLNINIPGKAFLTPELTESIKDALALTGIPPGGLILEISENLVHQVGTMEAFSRLRALGVRIILHDFSKGQSSLNLFERYPLSGIKINPALVRNLSECEEIIKTIISLAKAFNLPVTATGIEDEGQAEKLKEWGVDFAQGSLWPPDKN